MEGTKRSSLGARKSFKRKKDNNKRLVRSIVSYLKSDAYLFAPLFSNFPPLTTEINTPPPPSNSKPSTVVDDISMAGSERVKEYLKSNCHMYAPMISSSPPKLGSSLKGKMQITNLVTMEVSTNTTTMKEDNINYSNLRSDIAEHSLQNGSINSPKRALFIVEGQRTGLNNETDLSPAFSSLPEEKMVKPDRRRVTIE